jgi:hypothetical protein
MHIMTRAIKPALVHKQALAVPEVQASPTMARNLTQPCGTFQAATTRPIYTASRKTHAGTVKMQTPTRSATTEEVLPAPTALTNRNLGQPTITTITAAGMATTATKTEAMSHVVTDIEDARQRRVDAHNDVTTSPIFSEDSQWIPPVISAKLSFVDWISFYTTVKLRLLCNTRLNILVIGFWWSFVH